MARGNSAYGLAEFLTTQKYENEIIPALMAAKTISDAKIFIPLGAGIVFAGLGIYYVASGKAAAALNAKLERDIEKLKKEVEELEEELRRRNESDTDN